MAILHTRADTTLRAVLGTGLVAAMALAGAVTPVQARQNVLVMLADDLGVDMVGVYSRDDLYGHAGEGAAAPPATPNIDELAAEGVLFRNAYSYLWGSSNAATTLTGRYGFRTGRGWAGGTLSFAETLIPEILPATHENAAIAKWLSCYGATCPIDSGFDYYAGDIQGRIVDYYSWTKTTVSTTTDPIVQNGFSVYATTDAVNEAIAKIAEFGEAAWFVWVFFNAPHVPVHVPPSHLTTIPVNENSNGVTKYKAAVEAVDTEIGRLLASIPQSVLDDTTVIFFGDNGTHRVGVEPPFIPDRAKSTLYEGGINVPLIVKSPWIAAADEGSESLAVIQSTDIFATVAEIVGVTSSAEDSVSLVPYLRDPSRSTLPTRPYVYVEEFGPNVGPITFDRRAIRDDRYKLIWRDGVYEEFFDLDSDPWEQTNLLVSGMTPEESTAYDALVLAVEQLRDPDATACDNGRDDDGDGRIDWAGGLGGAAADPGCAHRASPVENPACQDGVNNDGQLGTDFDGGESVLGVGDGDPDGPDPQCTYAWQVREAGGGGCGLGYELAFLLPALTWLHRRRSSR